MGNTIIKAGFRLFIKLADSVTEDQIVIIDGLSKEKCSLYVDICKMLKIDSKHSCLYDPTENEVKSFLKDFKKLLKNHNLSFSTTDEELIEEELCDLYLFPLNLSDESSLTLGIDWYKVDYVPNQLEFEDVTDKF